MKLRLMTGMVYVSVLIAFFLLKIFVHELFFDVLVYAFALIGTYEMTRALKDKLTKTETVMLYIFSALCIPLCVVGEIYRRGLHVAAVCYVVLGISLLTLLVFRHEETSLESLGSSLFAAFYPNVLLIMLVLANNFMPTELMTEYGLNSDLLILFVFVLSPIADSFAYLFGRFLRGKFPKKLAPTLSPNKTVIGFIGGLLGGVVGALAMYFVYNALAGSFALAYVWLPVYLVIGLLVSATTAFGDLVESCIKRKVGLKDMGKLLPGHGGILDRIDGTMFATVAVYLAFVLIYTITL